jgi:transcriptional regulator with XRE-family HTH domain
MAKAKAAQPPEWAVRLAVWRDSQGLTQETLAARVGCNRVTVARWELGSKTISRLARRALASLGFTA